MRPAHLLTVLEKEFLGAASGHHTPVMLWGPPGVGKSQMVAQVADKNNVEVIDIRLSQMEPSDLRGIPFRENGSVEWAVPAMLPNEERHGKSGILFLDEITSAAPSVSAAAYQLILDRRLGQYTVPDGWAIFAAGNRQGDTDNDTSFHLPLLLCVVDATLMSLSTKFSSCHAVCPCRGWMFFLTGAVVLCNTTFHDVRTSFMEGRCVRNASPTNCVVSGQHAVMCVWEFTL